MTRQKAGSRPSPTTPDPPAAPDHTAAPRQAPPALLHPSEQQHPRAASSVSEEKPDEPGPPIHNLSRLRTGQRVQVWHRGQLLYEGAVEEVAPNLGVVWIREVLDGYRRLIHTQDTELRFPSPRAGGGDHR